ncbi:ATP synthase subunit s, mitochondrial-like [Anneissia japonica]|uniref:ATP synthase subunit s, mitochondrial-like n=1 Tax=Anneissia japonica TaxID=1529436 RepID=UPI0014255EEA|nr:ATP synthase subunit s, mitochondrial-like [Anneissia japonica]
MPGIEMKMLHSTKAILWNTLNSNHCQYHKREIGVFLTDWAKRFRLSKALTFKNKKPKYFEKLPYEVAAGDYVVMIGGAVHYTGGQWFGREKKWFTRLPSRSEVENDYIDAIDFKSTGIEKNGLKHLVALKKLKFLSFADCPFVDDSCMSQLVNFRDSLTHLDISRCHRITANGFGLLHKLRNLERVNMNGLKDMEDVKLVALMLEDIIPNLRLEIVTEHLKQVESTIKHTKEHGLVLDELKEPLDAKNASKQPNVRGLILKELEKNPIPNLTPSKRTLLESTSK